MFSLRKPMLVVVALVSTTPIVSTSQASSKHPVPTTLCEVLSHPDRWNNELVSVSASYFDAGSHGAVLADDRCEVGVVDVTFVWNSKAKRELDSSIPGDSLGTFDHSVQGTWTGRFHTNYGKFHETFLDVQTITNLSVTPVDFSTSDSSPIVTSIEEVVTHPRMFDHKTISFHSRIESDGMHGSWVSECGHANTEVGISIMSSAGAIGEQSLEHALNQGGPGTLDKTIWADWTGRLTWLPRATPFHPVYQIQIISIKNLTVSMHEEAVLDCESAAKSAPVQH
jgi:hypothetical protein